MHGGAQRSHAPSGSTRGDSRCKLVALPAARDLRPAQARIEKALALTVRHAATQPLDRAQPMPARGQRRVLAIARFRQERGMSTELARVDAAKLVRELFELAAPCAQRGIVPFPRQHALRDAHWRARACRAQMRHSQRAGRCPDDRVTLAHGLGSFDGGGKARTNASVFQDKHRTRHALQLTAAVPARARLFRKRSL